MTKLKKLTKLFYLALIVGQLLTTLAMAQGGKELLVIDVKGPVTPIMFSIIKRAITEADIRNSEALIIRLDTPGGSVNITREIIQIMIASDVPIVVYVWPPGGFAASAGTFITLAAHAAAMSPNTTIGAASPINAGGGDIDKTSKAKIENVLVADITSLADRRGEKATEWVKEAITKAKAANAKEALEIGIIDFIAKDTAELLTQLNGFVVEVNNEKVTLNTSNARLVYLETTAIEQFLSIITNPSIALLLISVGGLALTYEFINPGGYMGGIIGIIMLLIGFYGMGQLPVNYTGLALIILALILFVSEIFTPTFGALTAGGVVSFIIGGLILFNTNEISYQLPLLSLIGIPLSLAAIFGFGVRKMAQSMKTEPITGQEGLIGAIGTVKVELHPQGTILVLGERWHATSEDRQTIPVGERVKVSEMDGFNLKVNRLLKSTTHRP